MFPEYITQIKFSIQRLILVWFIFGREEMKFSERLFLLIRSCRFTWFDNRFMTTGNILETTRIKILTVKRPLGLETYFRFSFSLLMFYPQSL